MHALTLAKRCAGNRDGGVGLNNQAIANRSWATPITALQRVQKIEVKEQQACALLQANDTDTTVMQCWGNNDFGQLGNNSTTDSHAIVPVRGVEGQGALQDISDISLGVGHSCAVLDDGRLACWGRNTSGELGDGSEENRLLPTLVKDPSGNGLLNDIAPVTSVAAGRTFTCALMANGHVYCWGNNANGQLGNGLISDTPFSLPAQVLPPEN